jgi:hypothetical protein
MDKISKKGVILVFRGESSEDFKEIAKRAYKLDPKIRILGFSGKIEPQKIPQGFFSIPHLVIYLVNPPPDDFVHESPMLAVRYMDKIEEYEHFKKHNLPCLPIEEFRWGMELDPEIYGDWVVLKPQNIQSTGKDVNMVRTKLVPTLKLSDFPEDHLINQDSYYVQKFVYCGERPTHYRVTIFLNTILFSSRAQSKLDFPKLGSKVSDYLKATVASNMRVNRNTMLYVDDEINDFALLAASKFSRFPLIGIDILRDQASGKLFVLEMNLGGNTWHFSSDVGKEYRFDLGGRNAMIKQYNSWDRAAEALLKKAHELAI